MSMIEKIKEEFRSTERVFLSSPAMRRITSGSFELKHYASYLKQVYFYTRDNPQIQALAAVHFRGSDRDLVRMFFKHAMAEIGHDHLALKDLETLGEDVRQLPWQNPPPATAAFNGFIFNQILNGNPIGYLGYLFFLEFLPTSSGETYMALLERLGVPRAAMTFLDEHAKVDIQHNKLMEIYLEKLVVTDEDFDTIVYVMRATGKLYADMLLGAFDEAENPQDWGMAHDEIARRHRVPAASR